MAQALLFLICKEGIPRTAGTLNAAKKGGSTSKSKQKVNAGLGEKLVLALPPALPPPPTSMQSHNTEGASFSFHTTFYLVELFHFHSHTSRWPCNSITLYV